MPTRLRGVRWYAILPAMMRVALGLCFALPLSCTPADPTYYPSVSWASPPVEPDVRTHARITDRSRMGGCRYIGTFTATRPQSAQSPSWWNERQVLTLAEASGSTDVVFDSDSGRAVGDGYECGMTNAVSLDAGGIE